MELSENNRLMFRLEILRNIETRRKNIETLIKFFTFRQYRHNKSRLKPKYATIRIRGTLNFLLFR